MQDIFNFTRHVTAYEIRTGRPVSGQPGAGRNARYVCERSGKAATEYNPLAIPALFMQFSEAHPVDENAIVELANKFGFLFPNQIALVGTALGAEPAKWWRKELEQLHVAVDFWEARGQRLRASLTKDAGRDAYLYKGPLGQFLIRSSPSLSSAAMHVLQRVVDAKLRNSCEVRFLWSAERNRGLVYDQPQSLQACLWLQFAYAIAGKRPADFRRCPECGRRFEVVERMRRDSKFCGNACRVRAYRNRKKEARRLRDKGVPFLEIARRLGSDSKTVKGWVIR